MFDTDLFSLSTPGVFVSVLRTYYMSVAVCRCLVVLVGAVGAVIYYSSTIIVRSFCLACAPRPVVIARVLCFAVFYHSNGSCEQIAWFAQLFAVFGAQKLSPILARQTSSIALH